MNKAFYYLDKGQKNETGVQVFTKEVISTLRRKGHTLNKVNPGIFKSSRYSLYLFEQFILPLFLIFKGSPYLLCLSNTFPLVYRNSIVVIHDAAAVNGDWFKPLRYKLYFKYILPFFLRYQKHIYTVSEFSKKQIIQAFNIKENKVIVLGNGTSFNTKEIIQDTEVYSKQERPFVLTIGSIDPRKNLKVLIKAFSQSETSNSHDLLIVGEKNQIFKDENLEKFVHPNIIFTGYLEKKKLIDTLLKAELFISVSLYEGFGIPVLEAISLNKNIVISQIKTYKEIFHGCGYFTDPLDTNEIAENIDKALKYGITTKMEWNRIEVLKKFTWENLTNKMLEKL